MHLLSILFGFSIPGAYAQVLPTVGASNPGVRSMWATVCTVFPFCGVGVNAPVLVSLKIIGFLLTMIGGACVAVLVYAGIRITISRGNEEGLSEGKKVAMYALLGLALATVADAVVFYAIYLVNLAAT